MTSSTNLPNDVIVYALIDPRDNLIYYVGITQQTLEARCEQHRQGRVRHQGNREKTKWLRDLATEKFDFRAEILERTNVVDAKTRERAWMIQKRMEGHPLVCREYGKKVSASLEQWEQLACLLAFMQRLSLSSLDNSQKILGTSNKSTKLIHNLTASIKKIRYTLQKEFSKLAGPDADELFLSEEMTAFVNSSEVAPEPFNV